ncbi:metal ABC transporter permease [Candidatus Falkowbacteria bacterium]|jgi:zinc transport system permease protein|nr:metal ABC transporter permease [Patescibacteria group bacterium]MDD3435452.1 metal ABC transporter permease [Patescibacteria group bacterium]MDD4466550.1 metal ABC transporter permease [Patescibacteria group bacterium]NCU43163.1 metal ABC transporter permease [Candidatus Falkowbacteria bacterium]
MEILDFLNYGFIQRAYLAGAAVASLSAVLGVILVLRQLSLIGDGLSHVSFGALALGLFLGVFPLYVALPVAILASYFIMVLKEKTKLYGDAAIAIVSAVGVAVGVILASLAQGFNVNLFSYLFGNILAISLTEVLISVFVSFSVIIIIAYLYHDILAATFDEELAQVSGVKVKRLNFILASLTAISVVLAIKVVGVMLVSALLVIPAVSALQLAKSFKNALIWALIFAVFSVLVGVSLSFITDLPAGATIVMINFFIFLTSWLRKYLKKA